MFLSWWRNFVRWVCRRNLQSRSERRKFVSRRFPRPVLVNLAIEQLEDRTLLTSYQWTGVGTTANWSNPTNWALISGTGTGTLGSAYRPYIQLVIIYFSTRIARLLNFICVK